MGSWDNSVGLHWLCTYLKVGLFSLQRLLEKKFTRLNFMPHFILKYPISIFFSFTIIYCLLDSCFSFKIVDFFIPVVIFFKCFLFQTWPYMFMMENSEHIFLLANIRVPGMQYWLHSAIVKVIKTHVYHTCMIIMQNVFSFIASHEIDWCTRCSRWTQ